MIRYYGTANEQRNNGYNNVDQRSNDLNRSAYATISSGGAFGNQKINKKLSRYSSVANTNTTGNSYG